MTTALHPDQVTLRKRLLERLRPFASTHPAKSTQPGMRPIGDQLFTYCAFAHERLKRVQMRHPVIGIVLSGAKELWLGETGQRVGPGEAFVLPDKVAIDVVNEPDERRGLYESMIMEVRSAPVAPNGRPYRDRADHRHLDMRVPLDPNLVDALGHAATAMSASHHAQELADHRLAEILMLLRDVPAARPLFALSFADRVRWIMRELPSDAWTVARIAERLGVGGSTLRRQLRRDGSSFRGLLSEIRMQVAHSILARGEGNVAQAAQAAGYTSRSHFARRYRATHGHTPRQSMMRAF